MSKRYPAILIGLLIGISPITAAPPTEMPDPSLWATTSNVSIEAVCYRKPLDVNVTESNIGAVFYVFLLNHGKHTLTHIAAPGDYGFVLVSTDAGGKVSTLTKRPQELSVMQIPLVPGKVRTYMFTVDKNLSELLKSPSLSLQALIFDPTTKEALKIRSPILFK